MGFLGSFALLILAGEAKINFKNHFLSSADQPVADCEVKAFSLRIIMSSLVQKIEEKGCEVRKGNKLENNQPTSRDRFLLPLLFMCFRWSLSSNLQGEEN